MLSVRRYTGKEIRRQIFNMDRIDSPNQLSSKISTYLIIIIGVLCIIFDGLLVGLENYLTEYWAIAIIAVVGKLLLTSIMALWRQPQAQANISFKAPCMPFTPIFSVFANIYLMMKLKPMTWARFGVWMAIGLMTYFGYGLWNSSERRKNSLTNSQSPLLGSSSSSESEDQNYQATNSKLNSGGGTSELTKGLLDE